VTPGSIARRYGRALFDLAVEAGSTDEVAAQLAELAGAVESLDAGALAPGLLTPAQRDALAKALVARVGGASLVANFIGVLAANDRLEQLPGVRDHYQKLSDAAAGRVRVTVRSASPVSDSERAALKTKFESITGRRVIDTVEVDPDLLGGVTVEAEGRVYDGSVRTQLARLERQMAGQAG
jgi:F-type H+-transporting ATPase subunit delta